MRKNFYYCTYILIAFVIISCTQDELSSIETIEKQDIELLDTTNITSKMLIFGDVENSELLGEEINSFKNKFEVNTKNNRSSSQEEVLFVDTNEVFVIESNITTSYIFQIVLASTTDNSNVVDNLVITDNGERFEQYVIRYFLTEEEIENIEAIDYSTLGDRTFFLDIDVDTDSILEGRSKRNSRSTLYSCPPGKCCTSETSQGTGWTIYETVPCSNQSPTTVIGVDGNDPYVGGGGGTPDINSNNNNNDPYDDYDPQNGGIFSDGGGGTTTGSGSNNNTTILTNPVFGSLLFRNINSYLETPLTDEQKDWLVLNEENRARADEIIAAGANGTLISAFPFVKYPDALAEHYINDYPELTNLLKESLPLMASNELIVEALNQYGQLNNEQIQDALIWGADSTVEIRIVDLTCCLGAYGPLW